MPIYKNRAHVDTLKMFNFGQVAKLNLKGLKCICGKPWGPGSSICAACGMVLEFLFRFHVQNNVIIPGKTRDIVDYIICSENNTIKNMIWGVFFIKISNMLLKSKFNQGTI